MKPNRLALILCALSGCANTAQGGGDNANYEAPAITFVDLNVGPEIPENRGHRFTFNAGLRIKNPNSFPIHARQVRVALGGSVRLEMDDTSRVLDVDIAGGTSRVVQIEFSAFTREDTVHLFPLSITGRVFFDSPRGSFTVPVVKSFRPEDDQSPSEEDPDAVD